ncbi:MAG TPA: sigma-54-dependent transcriptional regulator, partial [Thermoanaerobacterales bacterium]|nr:sigma-54-dependent transcriptional regulator [Thermoanaerobacterales bacterium]
MGQLKNDIKFTCARAYNHFCNIKSDKYHIHINIMTLPEHLVNAAVIESDIDNINRFYNNLLSKDLKIESSYNAPFEIQAIIDKEEFNIYRSFYDQILEILKCSQTDSKNVVRLDEVTVLIDEFFDKLILRMNSFSKEDWRNIRFNTIYKCIQDSFKNLKNKYDLKYNDNIVYKIACFMNQSVEYSYFADFADYNNKFKNYTEKFKDDFSRYYMVTSKMCDFLNYNLDISINSADFLTLLFYLKGLSKQKDTMRIKAVIVAHGLSTASSIANVANHLLGEYIFEAFDMPIDVKPLEIVKKLKYYLNEVDTSKGIIILVDMGSLEEIYDGLERISKGVIGIVNNITTQLALDAGCSIIQGLSVEQIVKKATERNRSTYKLIKPTGAKKKALITTCITGIGTAIRIKDLIIKSLGEYSEQIEIIAYDFLALKNNRYDDPIFTDYNVVAIIGTKDPQVNQVPFFSLEDIISGKKEESFSKILASFTSEEGIKQINKSIVKYFSLESVLNNITILNPDKILDHVEIA